MFGLLSARWKLLWNRSIGAALDGASRRCQYAYLQLNTTDDARPRSMTDRYFTGARRRKFWTFQNFRTTTAVIGAQWRSAAFTHGGFCALWRSTAFIHGFWTAAERRQKPPMCNSGLNVSNGSGWATVYPKKYAHGFCFAVLCCGYTLTDFPISIRLTSLPLWQSNDCPSKATLITMDKYFVWIHYERLHNHNKAKHNKTVCIFLGIYCMECLLWILWQKLIAL